MADRVAIIRRGRIVAEGEPEALISQQTVGVIRFREPANAPGLLEGIPTSSERGFVSIETESPTAVLHALTSRASERGIELEDLTVSRATLEDLYLRLVGEADEARQ